MALHSQSSQGFSHTKINLKVLCHGLPVGSHIHPHTKPSVIPSNTPRKGTCSSTAPESKAHSLQSHTHTHTHPCLESLFPFQLGIFIDFPAIIFFSLPLPIYPCLLIMPTPLPSYLSILQSVTYPHNTSRRSVSPFWELRPGNLMIVYCSIFGNFMASITAVSDLTILLIYFSRPHTCEAGGGVIPI